MPRKRGVYGTSPPLRSSDEGMARAFGLWLKGYGGASERAHLAAAEWRKALEDDYLVASQYQRLEDVQIRLRMWCRGQGHVSQGVAIAWLEWCSEQRVKELSR